MPTLQSPGIGSGLDVNGLVKQLVDAERQPGTNRINREKTAIGTEISALGTLKGALSSLNSTLSPLKSVEAFSARSAVSADDEVYTATATTAAAPGSYDIKVQQLAKAQQLASTAFGSSSATVGTGTLTVGLGSSSFTVSIDSTNTTLSGIRDAINNAQSNVGVRATIVSATDGAHLVLTSNKTGETNKITVSTTSTDGLEQLTYNAPSDTAHYTQLSPAQDSIIFISSFEHRAATNSVSTAIDGVTFTLKKESPAVAVKLDVSANTTAAATRIKNFVSQYNAAYSQVSDLGKYDAATTKAGPLIGDALVRSVSGELRRGVTEVVPGLTGNIKALANIGITTAKDGTLQVDDSKLNAALAADFDGVGQLFGSTNGIAARMSAALTARLGNQAEIATRNVNLDKRSKAIAQQQIQLDRHMAKLESTLRAQFTALDGAMARMQSTSSYLSQQLANLPKIGQ
jgi:flagellar hook-associated protein 2